MFCKTCGKQLPDDAKFCDACGTAMEAPAQVVAQPAEVAAQPAEVAAPVQPVTSAQPGVTVAAAPQNKKTLIIILAAAVAVVAIALGLIFGLSGGAGFKSPEKAAKAAVEATVTIDPQGLVDCVPDFFIEMQYGKDLSRKDVVKLLKSTVDYEDRSSCKILTVTRELSNSEAMDDLEDVQEELIEDGNVSALKNIKDACYVTVTALVDGEMEEYDVFCVKVKNKWYVLEVY